MDYKDFINQGIKLKESQKTKAALVLYEHALEIANTPQEKAEVLSYILHIHTDKMLSVLTEIANVFGCNVTQLTDNGSKFEWVFGTINFNNGSNEPQIDGYISPEKSSLFT